jgi:hypothetical protein
LEEWIISPTNINSTWVKTVVYDEAARPTIVNQPKAPNITASGLAIAEGSGTSEQTKTFTEVFNKNFIV